MARRIWLLAFLMNVAAAAHLLTAQGLQTSTTDQPLINPGSIPKVMHWCAQHCTTLVLDKGVPLDKPHYGSESAGSLWIVERFSPESVIIRRTDYRPYPGKAILKGQFASDGNSIVNGTIEWTYHPCCGLSSGAFQAAWGAKIDTVPGSDQERAAVAQKKAAAEAHPRAERARQKFDLITEGKVAPGSPVSFPVDEVSAWVWEQQQQTASAGINRLSVSFGPNVVYFDCMVNLVDLSASFGKPLDPFSAMFVDGWRPLRVGIGVSSRNGFASLSLTELDYGNGPAPDMIRERMVSTFLAAFPQVKLNQPFPLSYNVDQVVVDRSDIRVSVKGHTVSADKSAPAPPRKSVPADAAKRSASPVTTASVERPSIENNAPKPPAPQAAPAYPPLPAPVAPAASDDPESLLARGKDQVLQEPAVARQSFRKAADGGNPQAMVLLGAMYAQGMGGEKDDSEAVRLFRKAAGLGYARGMFNLGLMYEGGRGVPKTPANQAQAASWYTKAVRAGHNSDAAYRLGMMYEEGRGVPRELDQARQLYRLAATPEAMARLSGIPQQ